jgi:hypothetical protein
VYNSEGEWDRFVEVETFVLIAGNNRAIPFGYPAEVRAKIVGIDA